MPRASSKSPEEKTVATKTRKRASSEKPTARKTTKKSEPKKPRKTAVKEPAAKKTTARKTSTKKPAARKTTTRKPRAKKEVEPVSSNPDGIVVDEVIAEDAASSVPRSRKAPTQFAAQAAEQKSKRNQYIVIGVLLVLGIGSSAAVGLSDETAGQINVTQAIQERNERMANLVDVDGPVVAAPVPSSLPNGGFGGGRLADPAAAQAAQQAAELEVAGVSTTASSTTDIASSTADGTSDNIAADSAATTTAISLADDPATDYATTTVEAVEPDSNDQLAGQ